jgi:hypothetical protein
VRVLAVLGLFAVLTAVATAATANDPKKVIKPAVQAKAKAIAVKRSDLPGSGWKAGPAEPSKATPRCSYYNPDQSHLTENGDYTSPNFTRSDGTYVSSTVGIFVSAQQAKTGYLAVVRPDLPKCLAELVVKSGPAGSIKITSAGPLAFKQYQTRSAAYRIVFSVKSGKTNVPAIIDVLAINSGAVDAAIFFGSVLKPPPAAFEQRIVDRLAARITS